MTKTSTVPLPGGTVAIMVVSDSTKKLMAGVDPKVTAVTSRKFVPVIVTVFPPVVGPDFGEMAVTVGPKLFEED